MISSFLLIIREKMKKIRERIREIVIEYTGSDKIDNEDILLENGLDSISMIEIVTIIEDEYSIEFEPLKLNYETLRTIESISSYVETILN